MDELDKYSGKGIETYWDFESGQHFFLKSMISPRESKALYKECRIIGIGENGEKCFILAKMASGVRMIWGKNMYAEGSHAPHRSNVSPKIEDIHVVRRLRRVALETCVWECQWDLPACQLLLVVFGDEPSC